MQVTCLDSLFLLRLNIFYPFVLTTNYKFRFVILAVTKNILLRRKRDYDQDYIYGLELIHRDVINLRP